METKSNRFRDSEGHEWTLTLSVALCHRIRKETGLDFSDASKSVNAVAVLLADPYKLANTLWLICQKQAEAAGVSNDAFAEALDGDALDSALNAIKAALVAYMPATLRQAMQESLDKQNRAIEQTGRALVDQLNSTEFQTRIDADIAAHVASRIDAAFGKGA